MSALACFIMWGQILVFKLLYACIVLSGQMFETHPVVPILIHKHVNTHCNTAMYWEHKNSNAVNS